MAKKKASKVAVLRSSKVVTVNLIHWATTVVAYDKNLYGFPLMDLLPQVKLGHGTRIRVTVELLERGRPCPVRYNRDGKRCTKHGKD